ncbi:uncharacterized protein I303_101558 [Kwoniella dejecticola CBS 10117]|uniref:Uncharacterized protein n=1 Tax=Kwoniella dejecticola CBS 10117 TaxID=1296121 RepID=A0A1A6ADF3_9TREE|nr:uncharacterized protein I303_02310 [Kwoniella dejecticola CBS 10117]OBR88091.1 hypothetical protein I303_02310 [Kwoniella dejecticola CBS 10117]
MSHWQPDGSNGDATASVPPPAYGDLSADLSYENLQVPSGQVVRPSVMYYKPKIPSRTERWDTTRALKHIADVVWHRGTFNDDWAQAIERHTQQTIQETLTIFLEDERTGRKTYRSKQDLKDSLSTYCQEVSDSLNRTYGYTCLSQPVDGTTFDALTQMIAKVEEEKTDGCIIHSTDDFRSVPSSRDRRRSTLSILPPLHSLLATSSVSGPLATTSNGRPSPSEDTIVAVHPSHSAVRLYIKSSSDLGTTQRTRSAMTGIATSLSSTEFQGYNSQCKRRMIDQMLRSKKISILKTSQHVLDSLISCEPYRNLTESRTDDS